jgi:uncharacterized protein (DUF983 family)
LYSYIHFSILTNSPISIKIGGEKLIFFQIGFSLGENMVNESLSGAEKAKYCPHCGNRLEKENISCPNCGKQITDVQTTGVVERPASLGIIAVLWFLGGLLYILSPIYMMFVYQEFLWTHQTFDLGVGFALSVIYMGTAIGLWTGKRWSYTLAFIAIGLSIILGLRTVSIVSNPQITKVSINVLPFLWAVIVWQYIRKPEAKEYLEVAKSKKVKWKIIAGLLIGITVLAAVGYYFMEEHLALTNFIFCKSKPYDRSYQPKPYARYISGETVWIYLDCSKFECNKRNNEYVTSLYVTLEVFDTQGLCIEESVHPVEVSEEMKPSYVWLHFWIETDGFEEGKYTVRITVIDELSEKSGTTGGSFFIIEK